MKPLEPHDSRLPLDPHEWQSWKHLYTSLLPPPGEWLRETFDVFTTKEGFVPFDPLSTAHDDTWIEWNGVGVRASDEGCLFRLRRGLDAAALITLLKLLVVEE